MDPLTANKEARRQELISRIIMFSCQPWTKTVPSTLGIFAFLMMSTYAVFWVQQTPKSLNDVSILGLRVSMTIPRRV